MSHHDYHQLEVETRRYARSKGLTLVGEGLAFAVGILPLLYIMRVGGSLPHLETVGLYLAGAAFFLFAVWIGLTVVPGAVDRAYYLQVGDARAGEPTTPDWARLLAPVCLLIPIGLAGLGVWDAWQATVVALAAFGLYMYIGGRFLLREPATEMIGAVTILLGGLVAAEPRLAAGPQVGADTPWAAHVVAAERAALGIVGWLGVAWILAAIALHFYNRWLFAELGRRARANAGNGGRTEP